ncbi:MAG: hypothetical protein HQ498_05385 [Pseudohongiella sp.]|nr:hypothetical protein [Pseudohongiella sp.]
MNIKLSQLFELLGAAAVVMSLIFVGYELRLNREIAVDETLNSAAELSTSILELIGGNSSVWMRGCVGDELTDEEEMRFSTLVRAYDRHFFFRYNRANSILISVRPETWATNVARQRRLYPGLNERWLQIFEQQERAGGPYYVAVNQAYDEIKSAYTPDSFGPELCGMAGI